MASLAQRYPDNAPGDFYVDRTCIDCDTCRRIAPAVFAEAEDHSFVHRQPQSEAERLRALMALVACPTGSIGTVSRADVRPGIRAFPEVVDENVYFCGFTSKDSFGAWSYFVERANGNLLVSKQVPLHGRPSGLVAAPERTDRVPRRLLVLLEGADPLDGTATRLLLRVGPARSRSLASCGVPGGNARGT